MKAEEIIIQYACRVYEHQANEPQFDCTMAEFSMTDAVDMLHEYAEQVVKAVLGRASKQAYNPTQAQSILETEYKDLIK